MSVSSEVQEQGLCILSILVAVKGHGIPEITQRLCNMRNKGAEAELVEGAGRG